jgi:hypothetical protein
VDVLLNEGRVSETTRDSVTVFQAIQAGSAPAS